MQAELINYLENMVYSYQHFTGRNLSTLSGQALADALYNATFALVAHGIEADPIFNYGNKTALALWAYNYDEWLQLPSRLSAETGVQANRALLLQEVKRNGFSDNYSGIRIAKDGQRFMIHQATVWNIIDAKSTEHLGQAAKFDAWEFLTN